MATHAKLVSGFSLLPALSIYLLLFSLLLIVFIKRQGYHLFLCYSASANAKRHKRFLAIHLLLLSAIAFVLIVSACTILLCLAYIFEDPVMKFVDSFQIVGTYFGYLFFIIFFAFLLHLWYTLLLDYMLLDTRQRKVASFIEKAVLVLHVICFVVIVLASIVFGIMRMSGVINTQQHYDLDMITILLSLVLLLTQTGAAIALGMVICCIISRKVRKETSYIVILKAGVGVAFIVISSIVRIAAAIPYTQGDAWGLPWLATVGFYFFRPVSDAISVIAVCGVLWPWRLSIFASCFKSERMVDLMQPMFTASSAQDGVDEVDKVAESATTQATATQITGVSPSSDTVEITFTVATTAASESTMTGCEDSVAPTSAAVTPSAGDSSASPSVQII